jgi:hypothetical protein
VVLLAAALARERRAVAVRRALGLTSPPRRTALPRTAAATWLAALLTAAAAQPAVGSRFAFNQRTDAAVYFLVDVSLDARSQRPGGRTRLARAIAAAEQLRSDLARVPSGLGRFTDRVVPDLLASSDQKDFRLAAEQALAIGAPPPLGLGRNRDGPRRPDRPCHRRLLLVRVRHRLVIVFTDGESESFSASAVARALRRADIRLIVVRTWHADEGIYDRRGREDPHYRPDPSAERPLIALVRAAGGAVYGEEQPSAVAAAALHALGRGRTMPIRGPEHFTSLAGYLLLATAAPLAFLLASRRRRRLPGAADLLGPQPREEIDCGAWRSRRHVGRERTFS